LIRIEAGGQAYDWPATKLEALGEPGESAADGGLPRGVYEMCNKRYEKASRKNSRLMLFHERELGAAVAAILQYTARETFPWRAPLRNAASNRE
jgi:hypothetical protein